MMRARAMVMALALLGACTGTTGTKYSWVRIRDGAEDLEKAREACAGEAGSAVARVTSDNVQTAAGLGVFLKCMEARGWRAVADTPTP
ncbi:hypothetical protein L6Q96_22155 [Candidatus Binatia bacterium]|nr:hypothetical protein [Candidatus Binatia bacterium]